MVEMSKDFYREAIMFLHDKGYMSAEEEQEGMALLLEFGLSEVNQEELERNGKNMREISYAALKFKCYELYKQNQAIVFGLRVHVQENKALKKKIAEKGIMVDGKEDEWELWDDEHLDVLYNRYVFNK